MLQITVTKVTPQDISQLQKIGKDTFYESFSEMNDAADMEEYLREGFSIKKITAEVNDNNTLIYFAKIEGQVIGYLKLNFGASQTEFQDENAMEIQRIYVSKDFQGKNIGQLLYEKAIEVAKQKHVGYVWLGVWEKNPRAIKFYERNGFEAFDKHLFRLGKDIQTDILMKLNLAAL